jgi:hypothetical protein
LARHDQRSAVDDWFASAGHGHDHEPQRDDDRNADGEPGPAAGSIVEDPNPVRIAPGPAIVLSRHVRPPMLSDVVALRHGFSPAILAADVRGEVSTHAVASS